MDYIPQFAYFSFMKIVFFGSDEIAVETLETLSSYPSFEVLAVFTQPDKPTGRKQVLTPTPVKNTAKKLNLPVKQPKNRKQLISHLKQIKERPDFFIVFAYGMIFPKEILNIPKFGAINIHTSLLPMYRGASPIQEALLHGDKETGISIMKMDEELDHGAIFLIRRVKIENKDNYVSLSRKLGELTSQILPLILQDIASQKFPPIPQDQKNATFCRKITKDDGKIDFTKKSYSAKEILNMIKAYTPWPRVFIEVKGKKLKILEAEIEKTGEKSLAPGEFFVDKKTLKIGTKDGILVPKKVQLEGKNEMDITSFLNGYIAIFREIQ